jgi:hypothetical protein
LIWKKTKKNGRLNFLSRPFEQILCFSGQDSCLNLRGLQRLNVRGLQALGAADDFEFDRLAVVQGLVAISLDRGKMHEYIFPGLALDETKALAGVKPLHCSLFFAHFVVLFSFKKLSGAPLTETQEDLPRWRQSAKLRPSSAALLCFRFSSGFVSTNPETL